MLRLLLAGCFLVLASTVSVRIPLKPMESTSEPPVVGQEVPANSDVLLDCEVPANAGVTWSVRNEERDEDLKISTSTYRINNFTQNDNGIYSCSYSLGSKIYEFDIRLTANYTSNCSNDDIKKITCAHGYCILESGTDHPICKCNPGYHGSKCDNPGTGTVRDKGNATEMIYVMAGAISIFVIIAAIIYCLVVKRRKPSSGPTEPQSLTLLQSPKD